MSDQKVGWMTLTLTSTWVKAVKTVESEQAWSSVVVGSHQDLLDGVKLSYICQL